MSDPQTPSPYPAPVADVDLEHEAELVQAETADGDEVPDTSDEVDQA